MDPVTGRIIMRMAAADNEDGGGAVDNDGGGGGSGGRGCSGGGGGSGGGGRRKPELCVETSGQWVVGASCSYLVTSVGSWRKMQMDLTER